MDGQLVHSSVLLPESIDALNIVPNGTYVDCTFGRGGHSRAILEQLGESGRLIAFDQDPEAIQHAQAALADDTRFQIVHSNFSQLKAVLASLDLVQKIDGVLMDLGVSSPQLDDAQRGFSFSKDGPLDMRMNSQAGESAAEWIATASDSEIADVLYHYGEERFSRPIARGIVRAREQQPITTTLQLARIIEAATPKKDRHKHPATRSFQGIRIHINRELDVLKDALDAATDVLAPGGRLVAISFHSLEDRIVKRFFRDASTPKPTPRGLPFAPSEEGLRLNRIGKAIKPSAEEQKLNPRSRSSILRIAERRP